MCKSTGHGAWVQWDCRAPCGFLLIARQSIRRSFAAYLVVGRELATVTNSRCDVCNSHLFYSRANPPQPSPPSLTWPHGVSVLTFRTSFLETSMLMMRSKIRRRLGERIRRIICYGARCRMALMESSACRTRTVREKCQCRNILFRSCSS